MMGVDVFESKQDIMDYYEMALFVINLILNIMMIVFFEQQPATFPTKSQQYYRQKAYEPAMDV
jgi:hypothetical protein